MIDELDSIVKKMPVREGWLFAYLQTIYLPYIRQNSYAV
jgi:hypothetical protein